MSAAPPKSVVFETAPPTFVFLNVFFQSTVKIVDQQKTKATGHATQLQVTLRYHDTYDVVADQESIVVVDTTSTTVDATTGTCRLNVMLQKLTASNDGRAYCLEIRSRDGGLESAFSSPIHVVKEKLQIVQQPPDVWFKDEGGREKCMVVMLVLEPAPGACIEERVVPLQLKLLYESGTPVLQQTILRLFPDMRPNMSRGRVSISFRIDDVSKNHQGQSFILEIAPEKQATSQMFQDIAPARTGVIAIRSKRNKRKLNGLTPRNGSAIAGGVATPNGLGSGNGMMMMGGMHHHQPMMMAPSPTASGGVGGPSPSQRPRHLGSMPTMVPTSTSTPMNNNNPYVVTPHPSSSSSSAATRMGGMMMMPMQHQTQIPTPTHSTPTHHHHQQQQQHQSWSTHIQQQPPPQPTASTTPMAQQQQQQQQPRTTHMTVEWKLAGFEIHPDGTANVSRPIYRCTQCRRLVDVEMMNLGQDLHAAQCVFANGVVYRPPIQQMDPGSGRHTLVSPHHQQHHQQQLHLQEQQQQQYYANNTTPRAVYPMSSRSTTTPREQVVASASGEPMMVVSHYQPQLTVDTSNGEQSSEDTSPKALVGTQPPHNVFVGSGHRPVLTISPFMNKIVANESVLLSGSGDHQQQQQQQQEQPGDDDERDGNLFASNAFRTQMDLSEMEPPSPTTEEKLMFLSNPLDDKQDQHQQHSSYMLVDNPQSSQQSAESDGQPLIVSVGSSSHSSSNSLYNEMTSMGISVDGFLSSKSTGPSVLDTGNPLADFNDLTGPLTDEDQVFYILANMYSTPHGGKIGLPAFDQFERMLGFYSEIQNEVQTQVVFHSIDEVGLSEDERMAITSNFQDELQQNSDAVHSLPKYQHNLVLLREDALMFYWSQSIQCLT